MVILSGKDCFFFRVVILGWFLSFMYVFLYVCYGLFMMVCCFFFESFVIGYGMVLKYFGCVWGSEIYMFVVYGEDRMY